MRSRALAGAVAGTCAAIVYGVLMQLTAAPMSGSHVWLTPEDIAWSDAPSIAPGAQIAVLEGDPKEAGPFTFRLKLQPGTRIPVHTHPTTERVTVLSGAVYMGVGDSFRTAGVQDLPAGSMAIMPPGMRMYWFTRNETVIQINGEGPWGITYMDPAEAPGRP